ncbi:RagB/SusD family nutrient uptake outer membrane protein [Pedobacter jamesrossensis]|uniref:RagB/SusD family nutrient uptake outer membrane protein n=2 Tax=Pedobacter jamesrossensis TaxID=1908238 RepID=A0ABV8NSL1_9SPHI
MKSLLYKTTLMLLVCMSFSCKKDITQFLEKPPGISLDEDKVFSSQEEIEQYISTGYQYSIPTFFGVRDGLNGTLTVSPTGRIPTQATTIFAGATDEAESTADFTSNNAWNGGSVQPTTILGDEDVMYFARFKGIRLANILLERIDAAPVTAAYKQQVKAEAKFLRAINNFETFKRYGGFQIINKRLTAEESSTLARSSIQACVDFIIKDLDEAFTELPAGFPVEAQKGRVNKSAIAALKSRTLLYAASPLFNTGTPYISYGNNSLICYGNFSAQRWQLAADAALVALNTATGEGFQLLNDPAKRNPVPVNRAVLGNYRESWEAPDNNELILSYKGFPSSGRFSHPWQHVLPNMDPPFDGYFSGTAVNHRFIKRYEKKDGTVQTWGSSGNDLVQKYSELDPRFAQTVGFNGSRFSQNQPILETFQGGVHSRTCKTGAWMKKLVPDLLYAGNLVPIISVFRYNELLLNYAEAINEFQGPGVATGATPPIIPVSAYDALNAIRLRSGMPPLPAGLSKDQFRLRLQNERAIELAFENYRIWDVRRWLIAENDGIMNGAVLGLRITTLPASQFRYEEFVVENRVFPKRLYLHPYDRDEILRNPNMIQNPGW